jgi:hypothetical protein
MTQAGLTTGSCHDRSHQATAGGCPVRCSGLGELLDSISCILNITAKDLMKAAEIGDLGSSAAKYRRNTNRIGTILP